ncbi:MAG: FHA domain-containing protein [Vicinamibacterales bacterium]
MSSRLIERSGGRTATVHVLTDAAITIGRGEENDITLAGGQISRRHARITWDGVQYVLHDLGSKNGTFLNGERVTAPRPLRDGDLITLGAASLHYLSAASGDSYAPYDDAELMDDYDNDPRQQPHSRQTLEDDY